MRVETVLAVSGPHGNYVIRSESTRHSPHSAVIVYRSLHDVWHCVRRGRWPVEQYLLKVRERQMDPWGEVIDSELVDDARLVCAAMDVLAKRVRSGELPAPDSRQRSSASLPFWRGAATRED